MTLTVRFSFHSNSAVVDTRLKSEIPFTYGGFSFDLVFNKRGVALS